MNNQSTPVSNSDAKFSEAANRKRKIPSPIKLGQDYGVVLRKQEQSASPALKKRNILLELDSSDDEVTFARRKTGRTTKGSKMSDVEEMDDTSTTTESAVFTINDFKSYMEEHVTGKLEIMGAGMTQISKRLGKMDEKVENNGRKLASLESRVWQLENPGTSMVMPDSFPVLPLPQGQICAPGNSFGQGRNNLKSMELKTFQRARRSLRMFPIGGESQSELVVNLVDFMITVLGLPRSTANGGSI